MRRANKIRHAKKRMTCRQRRILLIDINAGFDLACFESFSERLIIHNGTSRCVDENRALLHQANLFFADQTACVGRERSMDRNDIRLLHYFIQRHQFNAELLRARSDTSVVAYYAATESFEDLSGSAADRTGSDDTDRAPCKLVAGKCAFSEPCLYCGVALRDVTETVQCETDCELCDGVITVAACVGDSYIFLFAGIGVDVIYSDERYGDEFQVLISLNDLTGKRVVGNYEDVGVVRAADQFICVGGGGIVGCECVTIVSQLVSKTFNDFGSYAQGLH